MKKVRALCLLSGGLDSLLAVCVLKEHGIEVHGIVFESPFFNSALAEKGASQLNVPLHKIDFTDDIITLIKHPRHGFGACLNPCIDCHTQMIKRAGEYMQKNNFDFISTGEVLNERPMSQTKRSLDIVARQSGFADFLVRPLSALLLEETQPEKMGLIDRSRLLALHGRSRKEQLRLAEKYKLSDIPTPAGGCLLTDPHFTKRLKDLMTHEGLSEKNRIALLKYGRHIRFPGGNKLIIGRNEYENDIIKKLAANNEYVMFPLNIKGPIGVLSCPAEEENVLMAASLCARYCDINNRKELVRMVICRGGDNRIAEVMPCECSEKGLSLL